ncbi:hypothetical protein MKK88_07500 [Methylobacterium sp. E-005]|uniref:hypothetical protein n=1 Tax=Methylobacterium sp. E-005 TaxID=2836549 RepID=UPI001FB95C28|nr:hypothetical protein [Methylobacterium sp. E-005]MCJ2085837.1 hypothetical protein [Methylobacterium sp. E-005]
MNYAELQSIGPFGEIHDLTAALTGAFAEDVDLGPRGAQIRALGESLDRIIEALRLTLVDLCTRLQVEDADLDLDQLTRMAKAARTYGMEDAG